MRHDREENDRLLEKRPEVGKAAMLGHEEECPPANRRGEDAASPKYGQSPVRLGSAMDLGWGRGALAAFSFRHHELIVFPLERPRAAPADLAADQGAREPGFDLALEEPFQ